MSATKLIRRTRTNLIAIFSAAALTACSSLPTQGPSAGDILSPDESSNFELVQVDAKIASRMSEAYARGFSAPFINAPLLSTSTRLGVGDIISVTIFEAGQGGLFSNDKGQVNIPQIVINPEGKISIPYASGIHALDRTPQEVEQQIVDALAGKALEPQVIVTVVQNANNAVTVQGVVNRPARVTLRLGGDRLSEILVASGGARFPPHQTTVSVTRKGKSSKASMQRVLDDPRQNIAMRSGDIVTVSHTPRSYTIMGSVNRPAHIPFDKERVTVMEAVGKASGLLDQRADPAAVFLFRRESQNTLKAYGKSSSDWWPTTRGGIPTVYWLDMSEPSALFHAQAAPMRDGDLIYVANADTIEFSKVLDLFGLTLTTADRAIDFGQ
ncbi:Vi polysaccharide export protein VexA [Cognatishimia activa]|uniref:Vi polysaccharide export protein VexA n=1 Tax=Cognatishimia activa TaxID=1715691 RepID=A0A0P1IVC0_9RHOB|nr:Vi polysaccharide export protein VexA [Cognatishimia activa]CUK27557.1 Vi polysaccharide export protein VexA [Cognatishimia activa]